ncbi:MAG: hypothetical protein EA392_13945 [Cryomorphaceae bacterium]|nr:MAG: hypothetical protein EA392_13945 [Cryomorphaceae bacterium]
MKEQLIKICESYQRGNDEPVVIEEPYIPYVPKNWNRVLVLSESQNLSAKKYVDELRAKNTDGRINRLYEWHDKVGVLPWDDGTLKLAVEAAFGLKEDETAVSNAVPWSLVSKSGKKNMNPTDALIKSAAEFWKEMMPVLKPERIITVGKIARTTIGRAGYRDIRIPLRSASSANISRISGMFDTKDLLQRYPEVQTVVKKHPEWVNKFKVNKVFFACHAVSVVRGLKTIK